MRPCGCTDKVVEHIARVGRDRYAQGTAQGPRHMVLKVRKELRPVDEKQTLKELGRQDGTQHAPQPCVKPRVLQNIHSAANARVVIFEQIREKRQDIELDVGEACVHDIHEHDTLYDGVSAPSPPIHTQEVAPHDVKRGNDGLFQLVQPFRRTLYVLKTHVQRGAPKLVTKA